MNCSSRRETKAGCYLPQRKEILRACIRYAGGIIIIPVYSLQFRTLTLTYACHFTSFFVLGLRKNISRQQHSIPLQIARTVTGSIQNVEGIWKICTPPPPLER
jgi:hypothetical protein